MSSQRFHDLDFFAAQRRSLRHSAGDKQYVGCWEARASVNGDGLQGAFLAVSLLLLEFIGPDGTYHLGSPA